jgi:branched-chain amino acid transport system ATP-binding protein
MLLKINNLKVDYAGAEILKGISLEINSGEIVALIGPNGAGKTTTLRAISGLKVPRSGEIWFKSVRIDRMSPPNIARLGIAHVPQDRGLFPYMSVFENLRLGAFLRKDKNQIKNDLDEILEHFPRLKERRYQQAGTLSGGEQQMLAIACVLMSKATLLLLDELSTGLSPRLVEEVGKVIHDINEDGTSILLIEQNVQLALSLAYRCYVLETGNIVLCGSAQELACSEHIRRAYLGQ